MPVLLCLLIAVAVGQVPVVPPPESIPTRLEHNPDGSVSVLFQGQPGAAYQIYYSDTLTDSPEQMPWALAGDDLAATDGWTEWVDVGGPGRAHPASVAERYYQVVLKTLPAVPLPGRGGDAAPTTAMATAGPAAEVEVDIAGNTRLARLKEAYDSGQLIGALSVSNYPAAINILREHGVGEATLSLLAARLGQPVTPVTLADEFFRAVTCWLPKSRERETIAAAQGYARTFWLSTEAAPPEWSGAWIGTLMLNVREPNAIAYFKWYDQQAERLHSVVLNWGTINNEGIKDAFPDAATVVNAMHQLIKARQPDAFVWVTVVQLPDGSDVQFLQALAFRPDGLLVGNLDSFRSPFERALRRLSPLVGANVPLVAHDFHAYWPQVYAADPVEFGRLAGPHLPRLEQRLQQIGYRGLVANYLLLDAIHQSRQ